MFSISWSKCQKKSGARQLPPTAPTVSDRSYAFLSFPYSFLAEAHYGPFRIALTHSFPFLIPSLRKPITDRFGSLLRIPFLSLFLPCGSPLRTVSDRSYAFLSFPYSFLAEAHYGPFRIAPHSFPFLIPSLRKPITDRFGSLLRIPFLSLFLPCGSPLRTVSDRSYAFLSFPYSFLAEAHYGPFRIALTHSLHKSKVQWSTVKYARVP